jgi:adenosylcobinamide kinase/adenosylcobinamide-phosphate guanylyltransferase
MGKLIFITGGVKSGKTSLALKLTKEIKKEKILIATCVGQDEEMQERIRRDRLDRLAAWRTVESGVDLVSALEKEVKADVFLVIDCLTLYISLLLMRGVEEAVIKQRVNDVVSAISAGKAIVILISNEISGGLAPENKFGRDFRDLAGVCNQIIAGASQEVFLTVSGIALKIKGAKAGNISSVLCRD